jgi:hypothetical protein
MAAMLPVELVPKLLKNPDCLLAGDGEQLVYSRLHSRDRKGAVD